MMGMVWVGGSIVWRAGLEYWDQNLADWHNRCVGFIGRVSGKPRMSGAVKILGCNKRPSIPLINILLSQTTVV